MARRSRVHSRLRAALPALLVLSLTVLGFSVVALRLRSDTVAPVRPVSVISGDWHPYSGSDLPEGGPVVQIMSEVLRLAGYQPDVRFTTWELAEQRAADGSAFGAFPLVSSERRRENLTFSEPLLDFEYVLFMRSDTASPTSAIELGALRVGGIEGYDYWPELETAAPSIERFATTEAGLVALASGEVDVLAEGRISGLAAMRDPALKIDAASVKILDAEETWARSTQSLYYVMTDTAGAREAMGGIDEALIGFKESQEYRDRLEDLDGGHTRVTLLPAAQSGLVELLDATGDLQLTAPSGTLAVVLTWPAAMDPEAADTSAIDELVEIKVVNGPAAGRVFHVEPTSLELTAP